MKILGFPGPEICINKYLPHPKRLLALIQFINMDLENVKYCYLKFSSWSGNFEDNYKLDHNHPVHQRLDHFYKYCRMPKTVSLDFRPKSIEYL